MKHEVINLNSHYKVKGGTLTAYIPDMPFDRKVLTWKRPAVIIVPGGAYSFCSKREGEVVAFEFLARGFNVFLLNYLCAPDGVHYPEQLLEIACSVDYIRENAKEYSINPKEIFAVGFSAGGHLVGCLSTDYAVAQNEYGEKLDCKLTAAGLIYPVISDRYGHTASHSNLFEGVGESLRKERSRLTRLDECVGKYTSPAFIFSTSEDTSVPPVNSLRYAEALSKKGVECELHVYKNGKHGMSTGSAEITADAEKLTRNRRWCDDCAAFFREYVKEEF